MVMLGSTVVALLALYWWIVDRERAELVMQALATGEIGRQLYRAALRSRGRN
ncbi:hypothetical protein NOCARDAX2BIS_140119 [Nocardioides sp. AX2bis]|nr:hypothetical protein NOCARDAX2BIS_140119 [Nocardioides sp. AX2bis]